MVGVVIGGLSTYIKKSRINTDINNASAIKKVISTLSTDREVVQAFKDLPNDSLIGIEWKDKQSISEGQFKSEGTPAIVDENIPPIFINKIGELLPEGLPESKSGELFYITLAKSSDTDIACDSFSVIEIESNSGSGGIGSGSDTGTSGGNTSNRLPTIVESHTHTYQTTVTLEPTCTAVGTKTYSCTKCDKVYTEDIPASHLYSEEFIVDVEPTCLDTGSKSYHCIREGCTSRSSVTTIEKIAHSYSTEFKVDKEATCTEAGSKSQHCTTKDCTAKTAVTTIPATGHSYGSYTTTKAATCTTDGAKERTCSVCNTKDTATIPKLGHKYSTSTYTWSSDCKTCTAKRICANNTSHVETQNATISSIVKTAATCTTKGTTTYTANFTNSAFATQIKDIQDISINSTAHVNNNGDAVCDNCNRILITAGKTYTLGGYEWLVTEVQTGYVVLQSTGVTSGKWPGRTMAKFGNGSDYNGDIDGQDISECNSTMSNLYNSIKSAEYTSASYGRGLFLVDTNKALIYQYNYALAEAAKKDPFIKYAPYGSTWTGTWYGNTYTYTITSNSDMSYLLQGTSCMIAPAFNLDPTKVSLSGSSLIVK